MIHVNWKWSKISSSQWAYIFDRWLGLGLKSQWLGLDLRLGWIIETSWTRSWNMMGRILQHWTTHIIFFANLFTSNIWKIQKNVTLINLSSARSLSRCNSSPSSSSSASWRLRLRLPPTSPPRDSSPSSWTDSSSESSGTWQFQKGEKFILKLLDKLFKETNDISSSVIQLHKIQLRVSQNQPNPNQVSPHLIWSKVLDLPHPQMHAIFLCACRIFQLTCTCACSKETVSYVNCHAKMSSLVLKYCFWNYHFLSLYMYIVTMIVSQQHTCACSIWVVHAAFSSCIISFFLNRVPSPKSTQLKFHPTPNPTPHWTWNETSPNTNWWPTMALNPNISILDNQELQAVPIFSLAVSTHEYLGNFIGRPLFFVIKSTNFGKKTRPIEIQALGKKKHQLFYLFIYSK